MKLHQTPLRTACDEVVPRGDLYVSDTEEGSLTAYRIDRLRPGGPAWSRLESGPNLYRVLWDVQGLNPIYAWSRNVYTLWIGQSGRSIEQASVTEGFDYDIMQLQWYYRILNAEEVRRFLWARPYLVEPLKEAPQVIQAYFGPDPMLILELVRDPEDKDYEQLFVYIKVDLPPQQALESLAGVDNEWLFAQNEDVRKNLNLNLAFA